MSSSTDTDSVSGTRCPRFEVLPESSGRLVVRSWDRILVLGGAHGELAAEILTAVGAGRTRDEIARTSGVPTAVVATVESRLLEHGVALSAPAVDAAASGPQAPGPLWSDAVVDAVLVDDDDVARVVAAALGDVAGPGERLVTGDLSTFLRSVRGRRARAVVPRGVVETEPTIVAALAGDVTWACYWRDADRMLVSSDLSGNGCCLRCLRMRERAAGAAEAGDEAGDTATWAMSGHGTAGVGVDTAAAGHLLVHVLSRLHRPPDDPGASVVYELGADRVALSRVAGLPVCPVCTSGSAGRPSVLLPTDVSGRNRAPEIEPGLVGPRVVVAATGPLSAEDAAASCRRSSELSDTDLRCLIHDLHELVGARGLVPSLRVEHPALASRRFCAVVAELGDLRRISASNAPGQAYDAWGAAWTMAGAVRSCLGEAVERYCALVHGAARRVVWGSASELAGAIPLRRFARFTTDELRIVGDDVRVASEDSRLGWIGGESLVSGEPVLVPAALSLLGYTAAAFEDAIQPNSNKGLAAGRSADHCIVHGLCELIEADALLVHFLNRSPVPELDLDGVAHSRIRGVIEAFRHDDPADLRAWDLGTDIAVPTVLVMIERAGERGPIAGFGMATRLDPTAALESAVLEALHATCWLTDDFVQPARDLPGLPDATWVSGRERAKSLGASAAYRDELGWLLRRDRRRPFAAYAGSYPAVPGGGPARRRSVVAALTARGLEPVAAELSTPDVQPRTGLQVWRALVPGLQPFSIGALQARDSDRLFSVPVRMGYRSRPARESELNEVPHPCP